LCSVFGTKYINSVRNVRGDRITIGPLGNRFFNLRAFLVVLCISMLMTNPKRTL
jgi:hypothetical protein